MQHLLSKSTFIKGEQCKKALYLNRYHQELRDEIDASTQAILEQGIRVGTLARKLFPGGTDLALTDHESYADNNKRTLREIKKGVNCLYEPSFLHQEVFAAIDILAKNKNGWVAYEVKSSTSVNDTYILDAALQYYLITASGIKLHDICIVHLNNQYVKNGELDIRSLFTVKSVLPEVLKLQAGMPDKIKALKRILKSGGAPETDIGPHCSLPYQCEFTGHCWQHIPENSVFDLANLRSEKKWQLYDQGMIGFDSIDLAATQDFLNEKHRMQVEAELNQRSFINTKEIREYIKDFRFPLHFMDFETYQLAVPVLNNCRPYQQIVFQYSLHVLQEKNGPVTHCEFLASHEGEDPRVAFAKQLIKDCGTKGDILVYNIAFEKGKLQALISDLPEFKKSLNGIINRLKDLMTPFQKRWYYVPRMRGSYSIKQVLPALVPELSYDTLEVSNGSQASGIYSGMVAGTFEGDILKTRRDLLEYCKMDTWAMVKIYEKLTDLKEISDAQKHKLPAGSDQFKPAT